MEGGRVQESINRGSFVRRCLNTSNFWKISYCERFEPRSQFKSRLSLIVRMNVVLTCAVVIFRVKLSCITSVDGIILWFMLFLSYV